MQNNALTSLPFYNKSDQNKVTNSDLLLLNGNEGGILSKAFQSMQKVFFYSQMPPFYCVSPR